jgi:hypothetical protein
MASLAGSYNVGVGQTFTTITDALKSWKDSTITGNVTFILMNATYPSETFPLVCTIPAVYSGGNWNLTIKPVSQCSIIGNNSTALINIKSINRLTIDGSASDTTKDLVIYNSSIASGPSTIRLINGASYNTIKNCIIKGQGNFGHALSIYTSATGSASGNNENLIENCDITRGQDTVLYNSIYVTSSSSGYQNMNNTIRRCNIYNFYMSGVTVGSYSPNTIVTECNIYSTTPQLSQYMYGIYTFGNCQGLIATRNRIGEFMPYHPSGASSQLGMYLTATPTTGTHTIANNFIFLDATMSHVDNNIYGIGVGAPPNTNHNIYYNSIYLAGTAVSGLSAGIARNRANLDIKNNIVFNNRTGGSGTTYCIFDSTGVAGVTSNYNDLYCPTPGSNSQYVGYRNGTNFDSLVNWQTATGFDLNSISLNPDFVSATDLHINPSSTNVNNLGTPISGITIDYDGDTRDLITPDIGADEYTASPAYYIITANAYGPGTITPSGTILIDTTGVADTTFTINPDLNCHIDSVKVDGINQGAIPSYTFNNVTTNHIIDAYFSINTFTITATAIGGGTITPSGSIIINYGDDTTFTITPNLGYHTDSVVVDGVSQGAISNYAFFDVTVDHAIDAYFSINTYVINATADPGGTIIPSGEVIVAYGEDALFTISANINYQIDSVLVDGVNQGAITEYTFIGVEDNHTIHTMFTLVAVPGWSLKESIPHASDIKEGKFVKDGGALTAAGNTIYAFHGNKSWYFYKYDPTVKGTWIALESIPYGKKLTDSLKINKKKIGKGAALCFDNAHTIYATKGNGTRELWVYDILANTWTAKVFVPVPKALKGGTSIAYLDGKVYLLAGGQKKTDLNNFYGYDVATDAWTPLASLTLGPNIKIWKDGACLTELGGTIYALKSNDKYNPFFSYNVLTNTWSEFDSIPMLDSIGGKAKKVAVKDGGAMCAGGGAIYAIKGGGTIYFWKYTTLGGWARLDTIPRLHKKSVAKTGAALVYANGGAYLLKGNNSREYWQYVPGSKASSLKQEAGNLQAIQTLTTHYSLLNPIINVTPNPFAQVTTIRYTVPVYGKVSIKLYNINGRAVETLVDTYLNAGSYTTTLAASNLAKGVYFLRYGSTSRTREEKLIIQ